MTGLILVAASGLAREVVAVLRATREYNCLSLVDDDTDRWGSAVDGVPVIGGLDQVARHPDHRLLVCAGQGSVRRALVQRLSELGVEAGRYATVRHPGLNLPHTCSVGHGSIILEGAVLTTHVRVGEHVVLMPNVTLTHDVEVGSFATVCAGAALGGGVSVGTAAYIGMNASVRQHGRVGTGAVIGMGAAVLTDVPDDEVWTGVPARRLTHSLHAAS